MDTRRIGSLEVSVVGIGCNNFGSRLDAQGTAAVVDAALDAGINLFDTADVYGKTQSEVFLGQALRGRRDRAIIATKFGHAVAEDKKGARPQYVRQAADASLQRLGIDTIDLYQLHTPDPQTPIGDTLAALNELVQAGKVREIGCSNFTAEQLREAEEAARGGARFVSVQNQYSLLQREPEQGVLQTCKELDIAFIPYFPLASGLLTGKYRQGRPLPEGTRITSNPDSPWLKEQNLRAVEKLAQFAESRGHTLLELAFSWLLAQPTVASVIAGAMRPDQVRANAGAATWSLTDADSADVDRLLRE